MTNGRIATVAEILRQAYQTWADANNYGKAYVVSSLNEMWTQATNNSQVPNIIICYMGDEARGPFETAAATHRGDLQFDIALIRGKNWATPREGALTESSQNARSFYDLLEEARDVFRALTNISVEKYSDYKSMSPFDQAEDKWGHLVDGFVIHGSVAMDYPQLSPTPENAAIPE